MGPGPAAMAPDLPCRLTAALEVRAGNCPPCPALPAGGCASLVKF